MGETPEEQKGEEVMEMEHKLVSEKEAAKYIGMSRVYLSKSRSEGTRRNRTPGPPFIKIGRAVRYAVDDLNAWIAAHRQSPK